MKLLKQLLLLLSISVLVYACSISPIKNKPTKEQPVVIANDSLEYQIIIIDIGFNLYLNTIAKPMSYYSQSYLENKNNFYVTTWNERARNPIKYNHNIYENIIEYNSHINYGLEVNYKLYWYFKFAEQKYNMRLQ
ncbi:MAG: DUF6146 family protein [Polaribacter sp.]|nr:DUF6146 family protein [Polaribacter sp.]